MSTAGGMNLCNDVLAKITNLDGEDRPGQATKQRPKSARMALYEQPAVPEGQRDNSLYAEACSYWNDQLGLRGPSCFGDPDIQAKVFRHIWALNLAFCKPPLEEAEVLAKCEGGRVFIQSRATAEQQRGGQSLTSIGLEYRDSQWWPGQWRVETVNSDPPVARLYAPFLKKPLDLLMDDFDSPTKVHRAVLKATGNVCLDDEPGKWQRIWKGQKRKDGVLRGLQFKLLDSAKKVEALPEVQRSKIIKRAVIDHVSNARTLGDGEKLSRKTYLPAREQEGGPVLFAFAQLLDELSRGADKITRQELSEALQSMGAVDYSVGRGSERRNIKALPPMAIERAIAELFPGGEDAGK